MQWMAIGPPDSWKLTLQGHKIWGIQPRYEKLWSEAALGDTILFYATTPVKGIIGYGTIRSKKRDERPLWPEETRFGHALWPLRFELDVEFCLPTQEWETKRIRVSLQQAVLQKGFQKLKDDVAFSLRGSLRPNT